MSLGVASLADESGRVGAGILQGPQRDGLDDWRVQDFDVAQTFGAQLQYVAE